MSVEELRDELDEHQEDVEQDVDNEVVDDEQDVDDAEQSDGEQDDSQDDDALDFSFDDDGDSDDKDPYIGQEAPAWVKETREKYREAQRENRKLKQQLEQRNGQTEQQQVLREKPTLDAHDYDSDAYEQDYAEWLNEKQQHESKVQAEQAKYQQYHERYKADVDAVRARAKDYDDVEQTIVDTLNERQQGLIQMLVDSPAKLVYALGKSPSKLHELSGLDDIQFAKQVVLMEQSMSNVKRNPNKPKPKSHELEGSAGGGDTKLAKLEAEAERTNDRSKVAAYKRSQRNK